MEDEEEFQPPLLDNAHSQSEPPEEGQRHPQDRRRPRHPEVRCDNPGCGKYYHWKYTYEYWFTRWEGETQMHYLVHKCPECIQSEQMLSHLGEAISWIEQRKKNHVARKRRTEEYQWALQWVRMEFTMLTETREVKKFLKQEMENMWEK